MKTKLLFLILITCLVFHMRLYAQEEKVEWKHTEEPIETELQLFHSTQSINLPTTETLQRGDFEFEISHRFIPSVKSGSQAFWGLDGPVNMRLALGYALSNHLVVTLGRSNVNDNVDFWVKYKAIQIPNDVAPVVVGLRGGIAWNSQVPGREAKDSKNFQYYGQVIVNTLIAKRLAIGLVPSYLYNSYIPTDGNNYNTQDSFTMGFNVQYYLSKMFALLAEINSTVSGFRQAYNPVAFGLEINTGGHFFKILLTN
ncbi:MAG: DUF5777 family beta-barrel protein, partial [Methanococcaceae archaeon]